MTASLNQKYRSQMGMMGARKIVSIWIDAKSKFTNMIPKMLKVSKRAEADPKDRKIRKHFLKSSKLKQEVMINHSIFNNYTLLWAGKSREVKEGQKEAKINLKYLLHLLKKRLMKICHLQAKEEKEDQKEVKIK